MKLIALLIMNNVASYGGAQPLRQAVLLVCIPFDKNTLGDIIAILDNNGNIVARYEYDAWGNCTVMNGYGGIDYSSTSIGNINPFRYRGYYYDRETGFYYLQTRYYDPSIMRFINADNYELVAELSSVVGQLNMYAYCGNNPIMYTDPTGEIVGWAIVLIGAGIGALIGGIIGGATAANNGAEGWEFVGGIALGAVIGAAGGALATAGGTAFVAGVRGALHLTVNIALVKETVALGLAVSNTIGAILGPLLGLDWQLVEWGPSSPDILPNKTPYSDVSGMKSNAVITGHDIAKFYTV